MPDTKDFAGSDSPGEVRVTVIVPVLNEANHLPALFRGIESQTLPPGHVIFVDAGSADGSIELMRRWCAEKKMEALDCRLVQKPGAYPGAARNAGVETADTDYIAFLDCGIVPASGWLEALLKCTGPDKPDAFGICLSDSEESKVGDLICTLSYGRKKPWPALPASLIRKRVFEQIGGFREDLRSAEDLEWIGRYEARFGKRRICQDAVVFYGNFPADIVGAMRKWFSYARSTVRAGVMKKQQVLLFGIWAALLLLFVLRSAAGVLLFSAYLFARGLVLPVVRNGAEAVFARPGKVPLLIGIGLLLDLAKLAGFAVEYGRVAIRNVTVRRKPSKEDQREPG
jgi:glycosyltransferase involved in cell wall biosynthesis